ncbi:MAG: hypothetical protein Kow0077_30020 [Anaerolineae bacterium]
MNDWLVIFGMVLVTYSVRLSVIALLGERELPDLLTRALRYVPPAALAAIVFPALLMPEGTLAISAANPRLIAGLVAAVAVWRTRRTLLSIGLGMVLLWLLQALLPA